ncbi:Integral membrane protein YggT, involved in response to extracytoplasmic stress (osmotic shock) [Brevundimonas diminuta 3F5N]|jgi:YggT family protein|uniref:Integral membrane protein YggT, involved in response to extracytoplasmic stress (Osmotic shock) n=1 Tax=Brevundimonas diminuta 3F5N TaxID=1255603 RepID=A0A1R4GM42_BREDI|nr:YggT family protein [Brevundimonas diminuta]SJM69260.1 Integral membrane protein YggT, involved in response to extracytoplasmic stress (osmotic shock) [Brevundimonas diminuta 3F5N]
MGFALVWLVNAVVTLMIWCIIASAILSWLFAFDVINPRNRFVGQIAYVLDTVTRPILGPIQRVVPSLGGIDITPIIALLALQFLSVLFNRTVAPMLIMSLG